MSSTAPWLALAVDWDESEMWDALPRYGIAEESTMGERLAWVCLLCDAKKKGRGGKVTIRKNVFQRAHRLTGRAVDGMLGRAQKCGAVEINGDSITLTGWRTYQQKTGGRHCPDLVDSPEFTESAPTHHPSPITKHTSPPPPPDEWAEVVDLVLKHGVVKAAEAVGSARAAGCNITQVRNLVEWWRSHQPAWEAGALYERLMRFRPDQGFEQLWPPIVEANGARQLSVTEFRELFEAGRFSGKPKHHATNPNWVFGTLKNGEKVECRNYPLTKKATT